MANSSATHRLLKSAISGDHESVNRLFRRHQTRLKQMVAVRMNPRLKARLDASDIVQDTLFEAAKLLDKYISPLDAPFYPWLRQIAMQRLLDASRNHLDVEARSIRREQRFAEQNDASVAYLVDHLATGASSPSRNASREETKRQIHQALETLADIDREVLVMRYLEQMSTVEIAASLRITERAVRKRHRAALDRMLEQLD